MKEETGSALPAPPERVRLERPTGRPIFRILAFIVCLAVLVAAFAVSEIWSSPSSAVGTWIRGLFRRGRVTEPLPDQVADPPAQTEETDPTDPALPQDPPDGAISVFAATLSEPATALPEPASEWYLPLPEEGPAVLIVHTCPSEAYLAEPVAWLAGEIGDATYSDDPARCVTAVGEVLRETLLANGISAVCCDAPLSGGEAALNGSYERTAAIIAEQLERYPSVRYVVDVRRDSLMDAQGRYLRAVATGEGEPTAQVLAVVGTDRSGVACPAWRENLAFAEALGERLDLEQPTVFRGVTLRNAPCNQQLAPRSMQLRIGTGANTAAEAARAARLVGNALSDLLLCR